MKCAVLHGRRDVRYEERAEPRLVDVTDAIIQLTATCICGSDLWPYRGINKTSEPLAMGHEYCGIVEEVGPAVRSLRRGQSSSARFSLRTIPVRIVARAIKPRARTGKS